MELHEKIKSVGLKIKMLRTRQRLKQQDVAKEIGISQAYLSNIEGGRHSITLENLFKLQEVFACKMSDFFTDVDDSEVFDKRKPKENFTLDEVIELMKMLKK